MAKKWQKMAKKCKKMAKNTIFSKIY